MSPTRPPFTPYFDRAVAQHSLKRLRETHVVVGDHEPEPRLRTEPRVMFDRLQPSDQPRWPCPGERR